MSSLVKNQIAKQLARFTKNLSPNKISVKFLKGEGELHNLELDETTLSELLELPPWIRLTKAVCNRISAKIHWTRLKTDPICLYLDCVEISMEAVDEDVNSSSAPQQQFVHTPHPPPKEKAPNRYGFVEKVVDGMFVQINSVVISFKFQAFRATFQMSRLYIQSTNPNWKADDLRMTRVKDEARGEVLTFKQVTWSTLRIDANALYDENSDQQSAPVRLITSHSSLRITIKKRLEDCAVLSARLELLLDDILWVFTQSQLQALAGLLHSVTQAMSQTSRQKGPGTNPGQPAGQVSQQQQMHYTSSKVHESKSDIESLNALFTAHDVRETCYHLRTGSIDIHLCDDSDQNAGGDGGAMHLQMNKLSVDYYPYHLAGTSRTDWPSHNEASLTRAYWVSQLLNAFRNSQKNRPMTPQNRAAQTPHRVSSDSCLSLDERDRPQNQASSLSAPSSPRVNPKRHNPSSPGQSSRQSGHSIRNNMRHPVFMLESCFVVRCEEFFVKPVTTSDVSKGETAAFLSSDKKALYLPTDMPAFQLDFTRYYYPGTVCSPVPCPNMFIQLNPIQMTIDTATCLWINSFFQSILGQRTWSIGSPQQPNQSSSHIDIRIEALMPKIVIPCPCDPSAPYKESRPQALQLQASQVFITNSRTGYKCTQTDMLMFLQHFLGSKVYNDYHNFPACNSDARPLPNSAWVNDNSLLASDGKIDRRLNGVCSDVFDTHQPSQVWCLSAEQVWLDFLGIEETKNRPVSFVDAVPIQMWIATPLPSYDSSSSNVNSQGKRPHSASPLSSPTHRRTVSEVISTRRKASEPLLDRKLLGSTTAQSIVTSYAKGLHNSVPSLSPSPVNNTTPKSPDNLSAVDGPPPAYELGNEEHKTAPSGGEPPPPYEALTHNGPVSLAASPEEAPPLPEKAPLPESLLNEFTKPDTQSHEETEPASTADMSLLIHVPHCVSLQLDHFQFVFLLRLQEMLVKLQQDLEKDKLTHSDDSGSSESRDSQPTLFFSILAREVDLNIVLPPAPDRDASRLERDPSQNTSRNASSLSSYLDTGVVSDSGCQSPDVADFKSHSRADSDGGPPRRDGLLSPSADRTSRSGQEQLSSPRPSSPQSMWHTSGRASASSAPDSDSWLMVGGSDKSSTGHPRSRTESYASNSINQLQSSASKDSNSKEIEKEPKDHKMVSIFSIEGEEVEIGIHFQGYDKVVKLICPEIKLEELGVINFEKYVNQKALRKSLTKTTLYPLSEITPMVRMRAEFGPSADRFEPTAGERGFAHIKANGINGNLLVSTLGSLADCFEDEVLFPPMPFLVELNNSSVSINNDLPPALISAPLPIPVDLKIENISVRRAHTGVFQIRPTGSDSHTCSSEQVSAPITRQVSISASQLSLSDSASVCSRAESLENEKQCLVAQMSVSRATLQSLQDERDALLKTIERLQQELSFSNREQDLLQEKMTSFQRGGRRGYR